MAEFNSYLSGEVSREQLFETANRLFAGVDYSLTDVPKSDLEVSQKLLDSGMVSLAINEAIRTEVKYAEEVTIQRMIEAETTWNSHSLSKKITDALRFRAPSTGPFNTKPRFSWDISTIRRDITGYLPLLAESYGWPQLPIKVSQWGNQGQLMISNQRFDLDPESKAISVKLNYPLSDGTRTALSVSYTSFPYFNDIITDTYAVFEDYRNWEPNEPFSDQPAHPSKYMNRAMEMLIEQNTTST